MRDRLKKEEKKLKRKREGRGRGEGKRKIEQEAPVAHESIEDWIHTELN